MSSEELDRIIPVRPPVVKRNRNPIVHIICLFMGVLEPWMVKSQLKILIPVGMAIIIVAAVK